MANALMYVFHIIPYNANPCNFYFSPEFKRFAALQGDRIFQAPRRFLLEIASKTQPAYSYRELVIISCYARKLLILQSGYMRGASTPVLGAAHGTDIPYFFGMGKQTDSIAIDSISKYAGSGSESRLAEIIRQSILPIHITRMHQGIPSAFSGTSLGRNGRHLKKPLLF